VRTSAFRLSRKVRALALVAAFAFALLFAASAQALPAGFWGVVPQTTPSAEQFQRLGQGGVESVRISFDWGGLQPNPGQPIDWAGTDAIVESAAKAGVGVLPVLAGAPDWAVPSARVPGGGGSLAPAHLPAAGAAAAGWRALLKEAGERYGPGGEFWTANPSLPERPIRIWQIWNEPNFKFFVTRPNPTEYGRLVNLSFAALRTADPGARLVLAGLFAQPRGARTPAGKHTSINWFASDFLRRMYKTTPGIRARFSAIALHPYSSGFRLLAPEIEEVRKVVRGFNDGHKGLWITELGWSSQPPTKGNSFAKGPAGQVAQLNGAFRLLKKKQRAWNVRSVFWFSVDDEPGLCNFCDGTGLFAKGFVPKKSWFAYVKFTGGTP
jgi:hypothetical protein